MTLLRWYDTHGRDLPWREKGRAQEPYKVWLSEIMLQQTTVAAVKDYYVKFLARWPTVTALAAADREDVLRAWAGLGYYARARNLHACAQKVAFELNGKFPTDSKALQDLPGIGPYTSAAIASIAFDEPIAAVDGNVERVISRLYAIETPLPDSKPEIKTRAQSLVPQQRAGDFAQAMMDLGATICTPKSPACGNCPYTDQCLARTHGIAETLPRKQPKKKIPTRRAYAFVLIAKDQILLRQRPDKGLLGGMLEVPSTEWTEKLPRDWQASAPAAADWKKLRGIVEHTFTHFHFEVTVMISRTSSLKLPDNTYRLVPLIDVFNEALPNVMKKILHHTLK